MSLETMIRPELTSMIVADCPRSVDDELADLSLFPGKVQFRNEEQGSVPIDAHDKWRHVGARREMDPNQKYNRPVRTQMRDLQPGEEVHVAEYFQLYGGVMANQEYKIYERIIHDRAVLIAVGVMGLGEGAERSAMPIEHEGLTKFLKEKRYVQ